MSEFLPANLSKFASFQSDNKTATFTEYEKFKSLVTRYDNRPKIYHGMTLFTNPLSYYIYKVPNPVYSIGSLLPGEQAANGDICTTKDPINEYPWEKGDLFWLINTKKLKHMDPTWDLYIFHSFNRPEGSLHTLLRGYSWKGDPLVADPHIVLYVPRGTYKFADLTLVGTIHGLCWQQGNASVPSWPEDKESAITTILDPRIKDIEL